MCLRRVVRSSFLLFAVTSFLFAHHSFVYSSLFVYSIPARGDAFVPYRNHPLTHLLRPSFEWARDERGDKRQYTLVLGAVGPSALSFEETDYTLRLVARAGLARARPRPHSAVDALERAAKAKSRAAKAAALASANKKSASAPPSLGRSAEVSVPTSRTDASASRAAPRASAAAALQTRSRRERDPGWRFHVPAVHGAAREPTPAVKGRGVRKHVRLEWAPARWLAPEDGSVAEPDVRDIYLETPGSRAASEDGAVPYWQRASGDASPCGSDGRALSPSRRRTVIAVVATAMGGAAVPASPPHTVAEVEAKTDGDGDGDGAVDAIDCATAAAATLHGVALAEPVAAVNVAALAHSLKDSLAAREQAMLVEETAEQATVIATLVDALDSGHGNAATHSVAARIAVIAQRSSRGSSEAPSVAALQATLEDQHKTIAKVSVLLFTVTFYANLAHNLTILYSHIAQLVSALHCPVGAVAAPAVSAARRGKGTPHKAGRPASLDAAHAQAALDAAAAARALYQRSEISARAAEEEAASLRSELIDAQRLADAAERAASASVRATHERERAAAAAGEAALSQAVRDAVASATVRLETEHREAVDLLSSSSVERAVAAATAKLEAEHRRTLEALEQQHLIDVASAAQATEAAAAAPRGDVEDLRAPRTPTRGGGAPPDFSTPVPSERRLALLALQREGALSFLSFALLFCLLIYSCLLYYFAFSYTEATFLRGQCAVYEAMAAELDSDRAARHTELQAALDEQLLADDDADAGEAAREAAGLRTVLLTAATLQLTTRVALVRVHAEACRVRATTLPTTSRYTPGMRDHSARAEASEVETLHWGIMQCLDFHDSHSKRLRLEVDDACRQVRACVCVRTRGLRTVDAAGRLLRVRMCAARASSRETSAYRDAVATRFPPPSLSQQHTHPLFHFFLFSSLLFFSPPLDPDDTLQTGTHETALLETIGSGCAADDTPAEAAARAAINRSLVATQTQLRDVTSEQLAAIARQTERVQAALDARPAMLPAEGVSDDAAAVAAALRAINDDVTRAAAVRAEHAVASPISPPRTRPSPPRDEMATGDSPTGISFPPFESTLTGDNLRPTRDDAREGERLCDGDDATEVGGNAVADVVASDDANHVDDRSNPNPNAAIADVVASVDDPDAAPDTPGGSESGSGAVAVEEEARRALVSQVREQAMMIATLTDALHSVDGDHSTAARDEHFADHASAEPQIGDDASAAALQTYYDDHVAIIETLCRALTASEAREDAL